VHSANMSDVSQTLFIPMGGRIYASEQFPTILYDARAVETKGQIPPAILKDGRQSQHTFLASASRRHGVTVVYVQDFTGILTGTA